MNIVFSDKSNILLTLLQRATCLIACRISQKSLQFLFCRYRQFIMTAYFWIVISSSIFLTLLFESWYIKKGKLSPSSVVDYAPFTFSSETHLTFYEYFGLRFLLRKSKMTAKEKLYIRNETTIWITYYIYFEELRTEAIKLSKVS